MNSEDRIHKKDSGLQTFLQTFKELHPLLEACWLDASKESDKKPEEILSKVFVLHSDLLADMSALFSIDSDRLIDRVLRQKLSTELYKIMAVFMEQDVGQNFNWEYIKTKTMRIADHIKRSSIQNLISTESAASDDLLFTIKSSLLVESIRFEQCLSFIGAPIIDELDWFCRYVTFLSKDIAFNWGERASIKEKERLFAQVIGDCGRIVTNAWLSEAFSSKSISDFSASLDVTLDFEALLQKYNLGYKYSYGKSVIWLNHKLEEMILSEYKKVALCNRYIGGCIEVKSAILSCLRIEVSKRWKEFHDITVDRVDKMAEVERLIWLAEEGGHPVDFKDFENYWEINFEGVNNLIKFNVDRSNVELKSRSKMASLWGVSNAICKIRKVN